MPALGHRVHRALRVAAGLAPWPAGGLVLLYHRIASLDSDPQRLAVAPHRFSDHLEVLCRRGVAMSLESMTALSSEGRLPANAFAITFDDGYADVLTAAVPRLRAAGVPATVFVATGPAQREFWWDELERMLLSDSSLPPTVQLPIDGATSEWDLSSADHVSECETGKHLRWSVEDDVMPTARHAMYVDLCHRLRRMGGASRERTLAALASIAGCSRDARPSHRKLSSSEIVELAASEGITIGSHTESHASLRGLDAEEQRIEIQRPTRQLAALIGKPVTAFAYPFGGPDDLPGDVDAICGAGITVACTTEPGSLRHATDRLRIPRVTVRDWPRPVFESQWSSWTGTA